MNVYRYILGLSALLIAGCAALFSVTGIASLFSAAFWSVVAMAAALEIGKLVSASFLHRYWGDLRMWMKIYMTVGVFVLMIITSAGIFGFLSSAYQEVSSELEVQNTELAALQEKKTFFQEQQASLTAQRDDLQNIRDRQTTRLDSLYANEHFVSARRTEDNIERTDQQLQELQPSIAAVNDSITVVNRQILDAQTGSEISGELGPLMYLAEAFNTDMDTVVKYFIFMLIFVFDPLAVSLVIAYNIALERKKREAEDITDDDGPDDGGTPADEASLVDPDPEPNRETAELKPKVGRRISVEHDERQEPAPLTRAERERAHTFLMAKRSPAEEEPADLFQSPPVIRPVTDYVKREMFGMEAGDPEVEIDAFGGPEPRIFTLRKPTPEKENIYGELVDVDEIGQDDDPVEAELPDDPPALEPGPEPEETEDVKTMVEREVNERSRPGEVDYMDEILQEIEDKNASRSNEIKQLVDEFLERRATEKKNRELKRRDDFEREKTKQKGGTRRVDFHS